MTISLNLYSTAFCHLCEQAEVLVAGIKQEHDVNIKIIEITSDHDLLAKYEISIPALKRLDNNQEIFWPFNINDIEYLIRG
jgi:hypothetical protein